MIIESFIRVTSQGISPPTIQLHFTTLAVPQSGKGYKDISKQFHREKRYSQMKNTQKTLAILVNSLQMQKSLKATSQTLKVLVVKGKVYDIRMKKKRD